MDDNFGKAMLTMKGIFFRGQYFTCQKAIKEQWFKQSNSQVSVSFDTFYEKNYSEKIMIRYGDELLICCRIEQLSIQEDQEYFRKLQHLKIELSKCTVKKNSSLKKGER